MPESLEHKQAKESLGKFFAENYGFAVTEYLDSGFEMDVSTVAFPAKKIMVEIIWSSSKENFFRDMTIVLSSEAEIKIVVVNPEILGKKAIVRYFDRIRLGEANKGYSIIGMLGWNASDETAVLKVLKAKLDEVLSKRKEKISDEIRRLKEEIFDSTIPLPSVISKCLELSKKLGLKDKIEWLKCELYGYDEYITRIEQIPSLSDYRKIKGTTEFYFGPGQTAEHEVNLFLHFPINQITSLIEEASTKELLLTVPTPKYIQEIMRENKVSVSPKMPIVVTVLSLSQFVEKLRTALGKFIEEIKI
jgi:hypothetical protein